MSIEASIEAALFGRVVTLDLLGDPPLAWPNKYFKPNGPYVRIDHLPNSTTRLFIGSVAPQLWQGILQLTVVTPLNGGATTATELAGSIAEHFDADLALYGDGVKVRIQRAPDVMAPVKADATWSVRVDVYYDCIASMVDLSTFAQLDFSLSRNSQYLPLI